MVDTSIWGTPRSEMNLDGRVDIKDVAWVGKCFGSYRGHSKWNPLADIIQDGKIDIRDIALMAKNFGKTYQ